VLRRIVFHPAATLALATLSVLLVACSGAAAPPAPTAAPSSPTDTASTAVAAAPTTAPATPATITSPTPVASPTGAATGAPIPSTPAPSANASPTPSTASGDTIRFNVVPNGTQAQFRVREQLASRSFPSDAVGTTRAVTGGITLGADGKIVQDQSKFVVDMTSLKTDSAKRDGFIQRNTLDTAEYPTAEFVPTAITGLPSPLPTSGNVSFKMMGNLTVHGATHPVTWDVVGQVDANQVTGKATTSVKFEDFGMSPPQVAVVLSVQDNVNLQMDFHLARGA